jgi:hypothetical protein
MATGMSSDYQPELAICIENTYPLVSSLHDFAFRTVISHLVGQAQPRRPTPAPWPRFNCPPMLAYAAYLSLSTTTNSAFMEYAKIIYKTSHVKKKRSDSQPCRGHRKSGLSRRHAAPTHTSTTHAPTSHRRRGDTAQTIFQHYSSHWNVRDTIKEHAQDLHDDRGDDEVPHLNP